MKVLIVVAALTLAGCGAEEYACEPSDEKIGEALEAAGRKIIVERLLEGCSYPHSYTDEEHLCVKLWAAHQDAAAPPTPPMSLEEAAAFGTGVVSNIKAGIEVTAGHAFNFLGLGELLYSRSVRLFPYTADARERLRVFNCAAVDALVLSTGAVLEGEKEFVREMLPRPTDWFKNPAVVASDLRQFIFTMQMWKGQDEQTLSQDNLAEWQHALLTDRIAAIDRALARAEPINAERSALHSSGEIIRFDRDGNRIQ